MKNLVAGVWTIMACVINGACNPAQASNAMVKTAVTLAVAGTGMNPLQ